jgi:hypothetical protein
MKEFLRHKVYWILFMVFKEYTDSLIKFGYNNGYIDGIMERPSKNIVSFGDKA